jgi:spermidine synthase
MPESFLRRGVVAGLLLCFFFSGTAGLIYQVAWGKEMGLIFGHTAYAVATVLAVFMGGLAAGSAWLGRWSETRPRPITSYAWLELGVAATGAASLEGLAAVRAAYVAAYPYAGGHTAILLGLRFLGAATVLFLPTFLMGGTLPVLVRGLTRNSPELGARVARLYWINTAGAVAGTFAAGFLFLPTIGLRATLGVAVAFNVLAGALALGLARRVPAPLPVALPAEDSSRAPTRPSRFLLICFAAVGATAMAYEIGWTRLLATQLGSSTYAFTLMLATFLAGIVLGSAAFEWWGRRWEVRQMTFAATQTLTALAATAFLVFFPRLPEVLPAILRATQESFGGLVLAQFAVSALAMLPAAVAFGFNFPVVTWLIAGRRASTLSGSGAAVGRAYAWNTMGAIVGAVASGFWLLPRLGSFHLLAATAAVNLVLAALLYAAMKPRRIVAFAVNVALLAAAGVVGFSGYFYDPAIATFNTVLYWNLYDRPLTLRENARLVDVVYFADGLNATITVTRTDGYISLRTNGKVDASNHDVITQLLLGHLGALAHPAPRRVLVIGFGGGMTLSALARYPRIERLDCVEIEPAVVRAAPLLTSLNRHVLQDPRVHIISDDARNFLFTTRERYDLIVSEPSNPWIAGVATLYTAELYHAARERLAPGGIFVQWVQGYSLYPQDLRMVLATFQTEFQGATVWHGDPPDLLLMAPSPPAAKILQRIRTLWSVPALHEDFTRLGMEDPEGLFGFYMLGESGLREFTSGARINTDDLTLLEYDAPRALLVPNLEERNRLELLRAQKDVLPPGFPGEWRDATLASAAVTSVNSEDAEGADHFIGALENHPVTAKTAIARGRGALAQSNFEAAFRAFDAALAIDPSSIEAAWGRAEASRRLGNNEEARRQLTQILAKQPSYLRALRSLIPLDTDFSRYPEAADLQRRLIALDPRAGAMDYAELAEMLLRSGKLDQAYTAMQDCLARDPYNFRVRLDLGELFRHQKKWKEAKEHLEFVRRYFPDGDAETYTLLYEVYRQLGDQRAAADAVRFGLRMFPDNPDLLRLRLML